MKNIKNNFNELFPNNYNIIFLHAHPDDESFLNAGFINHMINQGYNCSVLYLSAASIDLVHSTTIRQQEALNANKVIGLSNVFFLPFRDAKYIKNNNVLMTKNYVECVSKSIIDLVRNQNENNHNILISYDKNGGYGHIDHKVVNQVGRNLHNNYKDIFELIYEVTINYDLLSLWIETNKNIRRDSVIPNLKYWSDSFGYSENQINYYYELTKQQVAAKRKSMKKHKSQINTEDFPLNLNDDDFMHIFGKEYFLNLNNK